MFNLLISYGGWPERQAELDLSRFLEYTDKGIVDELIVDEVIQSQKLMSFPTLLAPEVGTGDEFLRLVSLTRVAEANKRLMIEYIDVPEMPRLPFEFITENRTNLHIHDWELNRTHWSCKNVDLFKYILFSRPLARPQPIVFNLNDPQQIEDGLVALMMPFRSEFDPVHTAIIEAVEQVGKFCRRVDDIWNNDAIYQDIVDLIDTASIVICDCTDRNPNVFYEMGVAHALGKRVIAITQDRTDIPFDVRHLRYINYFSNGEGLQRLTERLVERLS